MFAVLALASAVCYGAADFLGGFTAKRASTLAIVVVSQFPASCCCSSCSPCCRQPLRHGQIILWGAAAGLTGGAGVALLYRALAIGVMAVVAPTTAVCAVAIPVLAAVALGERPGRDDRGHRARARRHRARLTIEPSGPGAARILVRALVRGGSAFTLAVLAGIVIGLFFLALARTGDEAGLWPLVAARIVSVSLFAAMTLLARSHFVFPRESSAPSSSGGALDMLANLLYLIATRSGPLSVVVTLASLYPGQHRAAGAGSAPRAAEPGSMGRCRLRPGGGRCDRSLSRGVHPDRLEELDMTRCAMTHSGARLPLRLP